MSYYRKCPHCGANLDPCEICDCKEQKQLEERRGRVYVKRERKLRCSGNGDQAGDGMRSTQNRGTGRGEGTRGKLGHIPGGLLGACCMEQRTGTHVPAGTD